MRARLPGAAHANVERNIGPFEFVAPQEPFLATLCVRTVQVRVRCRTPEPARAFLPAESDLEYRWSIMMRIIGGGSTMMGGSYLCSKTLQRAESQASRRKTPARDHYYWSDNCLTGRRKRGRRGRRWP